MSSQILLITGGNTGLGFEIVRALCQSDQAYRILLGCRTLDKGQQAIEKARQEFPQSHSSLAPIQVDIESDESIAKAFDEVQKTHGKVDVLLNNAGTQRVKDTLSSTYSSQAPNSTTTWNQAN